MDRKQSIRLGTERGRAFSARFRACETECALLVVVVVVVVVVVPRDVM